MNITVEQLVNFGRFPYCKGHLKKEDKEYKATFLYLQF
jgi:iron complex transport system ATP-binding protein